MDQNKEEKCLQNLQNFLCHACVWEVHYKNGKWLQGQVHNLNIDFNSANVSMLLMSIRRGAQILGSINHFIN